MINKKKKTNFSFDFYTYVHNWTDDIETFTLADQLPSIRPPPEYSNRASNNNNICSSKQTSVQTDRTKYQPTNRSTSLPSRQSSSSNVNIEENVKQRRRYASDSCNNNKHIAASIVTSFLQYLRNELRATANDQTNDYERIRKKVKRKKQNVCLSTIRKNVI